MVMHADFGPGFVMMFHKIQDGFPNPAGDK